MKKSLLTLAAVALASSAAFAQEADPQDQFAQQVQSTVTRAQVQAELLAYNQAGVNPWADAYDQFTGFRSETTRAQVVSEFLADRDEALAMTAEDSGSTYLAKLGNHSAYPEYLAGTPVNAQ